jgi:hypothetical protein
MDMTHTPDTDVPVECPACGMSQRMNGLSGAEKQFLIDSTSYHHLSTEFRLLLRLNDVLSDYPGTRHPLIVNKLPTGRISICDEAAVEAILSDDAELLEFLRRSHFRFDRRFPWLAEKIQHDRSHFESPLVKCNRCAGQYMVLSEDYYMQLGLADGHQVITS